MKPFLKWLGGKTQLLATLMPLFPKTLNNYHELFLGGGSVLLALLHKIREGEIELKGRVYAYDANPSLIRLYQHIQTDGVELVGHIQRYRGIYDGLEGTEKNMKPETLEEGLTSKESYYYWLRRRYNELPRESVESSALFLFLNKTCYRGMYREGPNGFNVLYGHYKKTPSMLSLDDMGELRELLGEVVFVHCDFRDSITKAEAGDFIYLDPPYAPETDHSFVGYTKDGFGLATHQALFEAVKEVDKKKVGFVMSNAKVQLVTEAFAGFTCAEVVARRAVNSKKPGSKTSEVIVYNSGLFN